MSIGWSLFSKRRIDNLSIIECYEEIAALLAEGLTAKETIAELYQSCDDRLLKKKLESIHRAIISEGQDFATVIAEKIAMNNRPERLLLSLQPNIQSLVPTLRYMAFERVRESEVRDLQQPYYMLAGLTVGVMFIVLTLFSTTIMPIFSESFSSLGGELPLLTQAVFDSISWISGYWKGILVFILFVIFLHKTNASFRYQISRLALRIPIVGAFKCEQGKIHFIRRLLLISELTEISAKNAIAVCALSENNVTLSQRLAKEIFNETSVLQWIASHDFLPSGVRRRAKAALQNNLSYSELTIYVQRRNNALLRRGMFIYAIEESFVKLLVVMSVAVLLISAYLPIFQIGVVI